jgi:hypothetical protein
MGRLSMMKIRNYFIAFAVVFAISSAYALIGVQDAKAQSTMGDLIQRIEALESKGGSNVTTGAKKLKIGLAIRTRMEVKKSWKVGTGATRAARNAAGQYILSTPNPETAHTVNDRTHSGISDTHEFTLQRVRLSFDFDVNKNVAAKMVISDNRTFGGTGSTTGTGELNMTQGTVDLKNLGDISPILENISVRIGRWQMFYGDHRLIGHLNWGNTGRVWDGAKVRWDNKKGSWMELFATEVSATTTGTAPGDSVSTTNADELFWGLYTHFKTPMEGVIAEPYLIIRNRSHDTGESAGEKRWTSGLRIAGKKIPSLPGFDFKAEQAWQTGVVEAIGSKGVTGGSTGETSNNRASNSISAFAGAWGAGYTFSNVGWSPRIGYQYAFASGDDAPGTGSDETFRQLYPTGHARLGYMDMHGWQNLQAHKIEFSAKPSKKLLLKADLWFFEADEEVDDWYSVGGGTTRSGGDQTTIRVGAGGSQLVTIDDEYGQELDLTVKYKLFKNFGVVAGYSHYFTGDFMEDTNNGLTRDMDWAYLMTSLKF